MDLSQKKCIPCEGGIPKLSQPEINKLLKDLSGWTQEGDKIKKNLKFKNFVELMAFVNKMAVLAESEGHHPDFFVSYNVLDIFLWTHAISGLSENDFILAAKIDGIR